MHLLLAASLLAICAASVHAETFTVTRTDDPLPDACAPGDCSLREAMQAAEANDPFVETDTIALPNGTYTLIRGPIYVAGQSLHVRGGGSGQTLITSDAPLFGAASGLQRDGDLRLSALSLKVTSDYDSALNAMGRILPMDDAIVEAGHVTAARTHPSPCATASCTSICMPTASF